MAKTSLLNRVPAAVLKSIARTEAPAVVSSSSQGSGNPAGSPGGTGTPYVSKGSGKSTSLRPSPERACGIWQRFGAYLAAHFSVTARYKAPVSRNLKPSLVASVRATVLLPAPAGPSMATMERALTDMPGWT